MRTDELYVAVCPLPVHVVSGNAVAAASCSTKAGIRIFVSLKDGIGWSAWCCEMDDTLEIPEGRLETWVRHVGEMIE